MTNDMTAEDSIIRDAGCSQRPEDYLGGSGPIEYKEFKASPHNSMAGSMGSHGNSVTGFCRPEDFLGGSGEISYKPTSIKLKKAPWEKDDTEKPQLTKPQRRWSRKNLDDSQSSRGSTALTSLLDESANTIEEKFDDTEAKAHQEKGSKNEETTESPEEDISNDADNQDVVAGGDDDCEITVEDLENDVEGNDAEEESSDRQLPIKAHMSRSEHMARSRSDIMKSARLSMRFPKNSSRCRRRTLRGSKASSGDGGSSCQSFVSGDSCSSFGEMSDGQLTMDDNYMQSHSMNESMPQCDIVICNEQGKEVDLCKSLPNINISST